MQRILIDLPEVIETPRLKLVMPQAGLGEKLQPVLIDGYEDGIKWLNWPAELPTVETVEAETRKHQVDFILRDLIRYIIINKAEDKIVGRCAFVTSETTWLIPQFPISYFIRKKERSKGYATEAVHALTLVAFRILKAKKVEIFVDAENSASSRVPLKLGFKLEYTRRGGWPRPDGKLAEMQTYSLFSAAELPHLDVIW
jgi:RimJ/RimL family protein N-acetyltransferase